MPKQNHKVEICIRKHKSHMELMQTVLAEYMVGYIIRNPN